MQFSKTKHNSMLEVPQEYDLFASLFGPLGLFAFSFVKLERTLTWSYIVSEKNYAKLDTTVILSKAAAFEGGVKATSERISIWFNALRKESNRDAWLTDLNKVRSAIIDLNKHRNRLIHDSTGALSQKISPEGVSEPEFHFTQQIKSGKTNTKTYSAKGFMQLVDDTLFLKTEIRRLTLTVVPDAPNIEI